MGRTPLLGTIIGFLLLILSGTVSAQVPAVDVVYFSEVGCSHCDTFVEKTAPAAEAERGVPVRAEVRDILKAEGFADYRERLDRIDLAFIAPLLAVVLAVYVGVSSQRIGQWFSRRAGTAKVAMGAVFALLGVAVWFV
ncbi:MAG: hypothetical protein ACOC1I_07985 [Spirochaetota bacterium]